MSEPYRDRWESEDGSVVLYLGDAREVLPTLGGDSAAHIAVTDPPYQTLDVEVSIGTTTRLVSRDQFGGKPLAASDGPAWFATLSADCLRAMFDDLQSRVLPSDGALYVFADVKSGLELFAGRARNVIVWDKGRLGMGYAWRRMHEWIGYFPQPEHRLRDQSLGDIIRCAPVDDKQHPTEKPVGVIVPLLENSTEPGQTVLDPFMGSGPTGMACVRTGRRFIGIEIDPVHFATAKRRIIAELNRMPLFTSQERETQQQLFGGGQT